MTPLDYSRCKQGMNGGAIKGPTVTQNRIVLINFGSG